MAFETLSALSALPDATRPECIFPKHRRRDSGMPLTMAMDHVARLEARGHARRSIDQRDRRATQIVLTANGLAAHRAANRYFELAYGLFANGLTVDQQEATRILTLIREAVEAARQPVVMRSERS